MGVTANPYRRYRDPSAGCQYDTGSMYGNRPLCDRPVVWRVEYHNGSLSGLTVLVCGAHRSAAEAAASPGHEQTVPVPDPGRARRLERESAARAIRRTIPPYRDPDDRPDWSEL